MLRRVPHEPPLWSAESAAMADEDHKALLALRYHLDLADHEIAAVLGISRATVSSTASRAPAALAPRPGYPGKPRRATAEATLSAATGPADHAAAHRARRPSMAAPPPSISSRAACPS